jgi:hypothetical protein
MHATLYVFTVINFNNFSVKEAQASSFSRQTKNEAYKIKLYFFSNFLTDFLFLVHGILQMHGLVCKYLR